MKGRGGEWVVLLINQHSERNKTGRVGFLYAAVHVGTCHAAQKTGILSCIAMF